MLAAPVRTDTPLEVGKHEFEVTLDLAGTASLSFLPLARSVRVTATGNWPHPGFTDGFLPVERRIDAKGFQARWQVPDFNRSYGALWLEGDVSSEDLQASAFGVNLVQPVDLYQQVTRSVKYAVLFICLSLLTLFLVEHLTAPAAASDPVRPARLGVERVLPAAARTCRAHRLRSCVPVGCSSLVHADRDLPGGGISQPSRRRDGGRDLRRGICLAIPAGDVGGFRACSQARWRCLRCWRQ